MEMSPSPVCADAELGWAPGHVLPPRGRLRALEKLRMGEWKRGCFAGGAELFQTWSANAIANQWNSLLLYPSKKRQSVLVIKTGDYLWGEV